ncbi:MAG TPA: efflux RND transporter periplasmic adaptor subunit [Candidatus Aquilonibacter sp.]|nr:efflux RND transporter periplasmic adaptor subunit [Candidatus Aquilonibacter sp.]
MCCFLFLAGCHDGEQSSKQNAPPAAPVVVVERGQLANTLQVAGEFIPYQEVELHAKVAGYIKRINVDIGDHVKAGEVLATLDIPEIEAQVQGASAGVRQTREQITRAKSEVQQAQANYDALHAESDRLQQAAKAQPGLIAEQELDDARAKDQAAAAEVDAAKSALSATQQQLGVSQADQQHYASLADYSRITAPFTGVVTWRYADTGALIQAGTSNAGSMPVVKVAEIDVLRLRLPVPEALAPFVHVGDTAQIEVQALNKSFSGTVTRDTDALDPSTRTMQVEIDVPNPKGELEPGMYAQVTLDIKRAGNALVVPIQSVDESGTQPTVMLVDSSNHVEKRTVQVGISTANRTEILSGLSAGDRIIATNLSSYQPGELVQPRLDTMTSFHEAEAQ